MLGFIVPLEVLMKLGSLPLVFTNAVILPASLMYSLLDRVPVFTFSTGLGALETVFTVTDFLVFLFRFVTVEANRYMYCSDVTFFVPTVTVLGTVFLVST